MRDQCHLFLNSLRHLSVTLLGYLSYSQMLCIELAAVIDAGESIIKTTYRLEGDGLLILQVYEEVATVKASIQTAHYPNVVAVAQEIAKGDANLQQYL